MARDHKSMKWIETLSDDSDDDNRLCPDECENGHGESPARCPGTEELTRSLYDENAPLSERYWMGLTTVQDACWDARGVPVDCADYGFPSFERTRSSLYQENDMYVSFRVEGGPLISAYPHEIDFGWTENWMQLFDSILNGQIEPLNPRRLAQEVVDRVRHDLKLKYGEGAEPETLSVQRAGAEGGEA